MTTDNARILAAMCTIFVVVAAITCVCWQYHETGISLGNSTAFGYNPINTIIAGIAWTFGLFFVILAAAVIYKLFYMLYKGDSK